MPATVKALRPRVESTIKIRPAGLTTRLDLQALWDYRELLYFLILREMKIRYKQTFLGVVWVVVQPLLTTLLFTLLFGKLAQFATEDVPYPLFVFVGMLVWNFTNQSVIGSSNSMVNNTNLITKVYFPRLLMPLASVGAALLDLILNLTVLTGLMLYFEVAPGLKLLWLPCFLGLAVLLATGAGAWLSALNVRFRDVKQLLPFALQFWMFATPIFYQTSLLPEHWRWVMALNPLTGIVEGCRMALLNRQPNMFSVWLSVVQTIALCLVGIYVFKRMEDEFADVI